MTRSFYITLGCCCAMGLVGLSAQAADDDAAYGDTTAYGDFAAESETIVSEKPRATKGLDTVGKHHFQVETGFDYQAETDAAATRHQYSFPTQLRYGVIDTLEARIQGNMFTFQNTAGPGGSARGFGDLAVGTKWAIVSGGGFLPSLGLVADLGMPTGSNNVSTNTFVPAGAAILAWELPAQFRLDSNVGMDYPARDGAGDRFARLTYGAAVKRAIPVWDDRLDGFIEFAGAAPLKNSKAGLHQFGTGVAMRLSDSMNLSAFGRFGLNTAAPNFQTGVGFGWRL